MGWFSEDSDEANAYSQVNDAPHKAKLSHELIASAAAYEAMKAYNEHQAKHGKPSDHAKAKQIMAGAAGFFIDKLVESKGLDYLDAQRAKEQAAEQCHEASAREYK